MKYIKMFENFDTTDNEDLLEIKSKLESFFGDKIKCYFEKGKRKTGPTHSKEFNDGLKVIVNGKMLEVSHGGDHEISWGYSVYCPQYGSESFEAWDIDGIVEFSKKRIDILLDREDDEEYDDSNYSSSNKYIDNLTGRQAAYHKR